MASALLVAASFDIDDVERSSGDGSEPWSEDGRRDSRSPGLAESRDVAHRFVKRIGAKAPWSLFLLAASVASACERRKATVPNVRAPASQSRWLAPDGERPAAPTYGGKTLREIALYAYLGGDEEAAHLLGRIGPDAIPAIRELAKRWPGAIPAAVIRAISSMGERAADGLDVILMGFDTTSVFVACESAYAFFNLGDEGRSVAPELLAIVLRHRLDGGVVGLHGDLLAAQIVANPPDRDAALEGPARAALVSIGAPALPILRAALATGASADEAEYLRSMITGAAAVADRRASAHAGSSRDR